MTALRDTKVSLSAADLSRRNSPAAYVSRVQTLILVACLMPYLGFGPLAAPTQVQPYAALLAWLWFVAHGVKHGINFTRIQVTLIAFSIWFMLDVYRGDGFTVSVYFRQSGAFLLSAGIFLAVSQMRPEVLWRALKITLPAWLFFAALRYADTGIYFSVVKIFVPTVRDVADRGTSSLAPEATDFGFTMVFALLFVMIVRRQLSEAGTVPSRWPVFAAIACIALSASGTGFVGLFVVGLLYIGSSRNGRSARVGRYVVLIGGLVLALGVLLVTPASGIRGIDLLSSTVTSPRTLFNTTAVYRIMHNIVGFLGMQDSGYFGYGAGSFTVKAPEIYYQHALAVKFELQGHYLTAVPETLARSPLAYFAAILLEFGLVGVAYIGLLFGMAARSHAQFKAIGFVLLIFAWGQSFPAAWPPFWVLVGLMMNSRFASADRQAAAT